MVVRRIVRRRALMTGFAVALSVALVMGPVRVRALLQSAVGGPSPATGHAEVIAQGVAALPAKTVAWRIGERSALPLAQALFEAEPLGFVLAQGDPILVDDAATNAQTRLAGGEALFVAGGGGQTRAGVGAQSAKYMAISLVTSENAPNPGNVFPAPDGLRDIDLVRDVLAANEKTAIAGTDAPILVLVTAGSIAVATGGAGGPTQTVGTGAAAVFKGDLTLTNTGKVDAVVVTGVIGPKVPPPTPRATGSLTVTVYGCPAGVAVADLPAAGASGANPCEPVDAGNAGVGLSLAGPSGRALTLADAAVSADVPGSYAWSSLPYGAYTVVEAATPPDGYGDQVLVDGAGAVVKDGGVSLQAGAADVTVALYLLKATAGSVTARVFNCPPGMTAETLAAADCTAVTE